MIQHTLFFPLIQNYVNRQKYLKLLEWIMIEYIHKYNDNNLLYNTNDKIDVLNEFDV